jgi:hypothetical protein
LSSPQAFWPQATVTGPPSFAVALVEQLQEVEASAPHVWPVHVQPELLQEYVTSSSPHAV